MPKWQTTGALLSAALSVSIGCGSTSTGVVEERVEETDATANDTSGPGQSSGTSDTTVTDTDTYTGVTGPLGWRVLPNSPVGGYWNHDDVFFHDENTGWIADISGQIYKTTDGGDSWEQQADNEGTSYRALAFLDDQTGFVGTLGPGGWVGQTTDDVLLYGTSDGGDTWTEVTTIQGADALQGICGLRRIDAQTIYGVGRYDGPAGFIKTTDGGATWTAQNVNLAHGLVDLHFFDANTGLLGGRRGGQSIILRTTDGGDTFTTVAASSSDHVWKIFFLDDTTGYANISNYSWNTPRHYLKTVDAGLTWTEVPYTPPVDNYEGLGIGFYTEDLGWAAGGRETYETVDGGTTFQTVRMDPMLEDTINRFIRVNDIMYAAGARIYKYDALGGVPANPPNPPGAEVDPPKLELSPNPFHGQGTLTYAVPESGPVSIGVTAIGGRLIEELVHETKQAGEYQLEYTPKYSQKFVRITVLAGEHRKSIGVVREGGGEYLKTP